LHDSGVVSQKNMVMTPAGPEAKNYCAGEDQQQCTRTEPEGNRALGEPRRRWEDNINTGLREVGWGGIDSICLSQIRAQWMALVNTVMNIRVL
jgi:hypothetical protein